ncbi:MAG TPA: hemerythrin domain-containing protein [Alphaproteobacteria bacterium]|jgi:hemerythrin superfamily protein
MNILKALKSDHVAVKAILADILKTTERAEKKRKTLFDKFKAEIVAHSRAEEIVVYERLKSIKEDRDTILEGYEEHYLVDKLIAEIERLSPSDEVWTAKVTIVKEMLEHHIEEEEKEIFSMLRKEFDPDSLNTFGEQFEGLKAQRKGKAAKAAA